MKKVVYTTATYIYGVWTTKVCFPQRSILITWNIIEKISQIHVVLIFVNNILVELSPLQQIFSIFIDTSCFYWKNFMKNFK